MSVKRECESAKSELWHIHDVACVLVVVCHDVSKSGVDLALDDLKGLIALQPGIAHSAAWHEMARDHQKTRLVVRMHGAKGHGRGYPSVGGPFPAFHLSFTFGHTISTSLCDATSGSSHPLG